MSPSTTLRTSRLARLFKQVKKSRKKKVFSIFLTLGYPTLAFTEKMILAAEAAGVDLIELGFPFSDPLADGPVIQHSSEAALRKGIKFQDGLKLMKKLRSSGVKIPVLLFSYFNPVFNRGESRVARELRGAGFDGCLIPDLPPEEGEVFHRALRKEKLSLIYFLAPTSTPKRIRLVSRRTDEFIYYVSSRGVTGVRKKLDADLKKNLGKIKRLARKPVLIGFGISDKNKVSEAARISNGVIVGSALVRAIGTYGTSDKGFQKITRFLRGLRAGLTEPEGSVV